MASLGSAPLCEAEILGTLNMDCACCICFQPPLPDQAVIVTPCHHLFCRPCLDQAMSKKTECPVDRAPIDGASVRVEAADEASLALVRGVGVQCSARRHGCQWEGTWGQWVLEDHGATCALRGHGVVELCVVPSCPAGSIQALESIATNILPPSDHEVSHLYEHIRLLSHTVTSMEEQHRTLKWEMDQLKERLYSAQNDISDWQHATRREQEASATSEQRFLQQLNILATNTRPLFPTITVPGVSLTSAADDTHLASGALLWDEHCCSRSAAVEQATLAHSGTMKGWATGFARGGVKVRRGGRRAMVRFQVSSDVDDGSQVPSSVIMIGLAVHRPTTTISATQHVGSMSGCWAYQGSGFLWDGNIGRCGQLVAPSGVDDGATTFGPGDIITLTLEPLDDVCRIIVSKQRDTTPPGATTCLGVGGTIPLHVIEEVVLFPVVSLGAPRCKVSLQ
jgi:hypothetical protein